MSDHPQETPESIDHDPVGRDPREHPWGYFSYSDVPPAFCGSGTGIFV